MMKKRREATAAHVIAGGAIINGSRDGGSSYDLQPEWDALRAHSLSNRTVRLHTKA